MMAAQSQTVTGLFSTLGDTVTLSLTKVGETITEKLDLRGVIGNVTTAVQALADTAMPYIETFIGGLGQSGNIGQAAGNLILSAAQMMATGLAYAIDYSQLLVVGFKSLQAGAALAIGELLKSIDFLGGGLVKLLNLLPGVNLQWTDTIGAMADAVLDESDKLAGEAGAAWDSFANADSAGKVGKFFDQVRTNAAKAQQATTGVGDAAQQTAMKIEQAAATQNAKVGEMVKSLQEQVAEAGQSDLQKKLGDATAAGASPEQLAQITKLQQQLDALAAANKHSDDLMSKGKEIFEATRTPMEQYQQKLAELKDMLNAGALDWDTYSRAVAKAQADMQGTGDVGQAPEAPKLELASSAAAQKHLYEIGRNVNQARDDMPKQQLVEAKSGNRILQQIARNTEGTGGTLVKI